MLFVLEEYIHFMLYEVPNSAGKDEDFLADYVSVRNICAVTRLKYLSNLASYDAETSKYSLVDEIIPCRWLTDDFIAQINFSQNQFGKYCIKG